MCLNGPRNENGGENGAAKDGKKVKAILLLQDGTRFEGYSFGAMTNTIGEIGTYMSNLSFGVKFISIRILMYAQGR